MLNAKFCCGEIPAITYTPEEVHTREGGHPAVYEITCGVCGRKLRVEETEEEANQSFEINLTFNRAVELWNKSIVE